MSRLDKAPFWAGLLLSVIVAVAVSAALAYSGGFAPAAAPSPSAISDRVDTNALISAQGPASVTPSAAAPALPSGVPDHGPLMFDFGSMLSSGKVPANIGNPQLDKVQVVGQSVRFEVSNASRALVPLPSNVQPSSFVAVIKVDLLSGAGAFTFTFHGDQGGGHQHAVQVYTTGTTEAVLFDGPAGTRSLLRPVNQVPALSGSATLAVAVNGPAMRIYVNGVEAGTAEDGTLSQGSMGFKAGAAAREEPFVLRLTDLKVFAPA